MKNKLIDLNNHLFAQLERLSEENISQEQIEVEIARTKPINEIAKNIIDNADLMLKAEELKAKHNCAKVQVPQIIDVSYAETQPPKLIGNR